MLIAHFVFGIFGNITALTLFLVPLITFWKITKNKSTEEFSGIPYVSTLLNCLLSAWYGLPFVSANNLLVSTVNGTGAVLELCYVIVFLFYIRDKKYRVKIFGLLVIVLIFFAMVALVSLLALDGHGRKLFCGFAAAIFSICMYASPLSIMDLRLTCGLRNRDSGASKPSKSPGDRTRPEPHQPLTWLDFLSPQRTVIKTKSVKYMPFFLSVFVFLCGTSWFVYGLLGKDPFVSVPNGVGSVLGAMQLILYAVYKDWKKNNSDTSSPPVQEEGKAGADHMNGLEMGSYGRANADSPPQTS